jgi:hypothetical protein
MKRVTKSHHTDQIGVHAVAQKVHKELGWLLRPQDQDYGIDALIEVVVDSLPTGKIIAAQIKSGASYFKSKNAKGIKFRGKSEHLSYWLNHDLPVIVVLYDPDTGTAYWQHVTKENVKLTAKGWLMTIPIEQKIEPSQTNNLEKLASKLSQAKSALKEFTCPHCGAELVERGGEFVGPNDDHYGLHEIFACGYHAFDWVMRRPCPHDPKFPRFEDYELQSHAPSKPDGSWFCIAVPKTEMAKFLQLTGTGKTKEEAEQRVRKSYDSYAACKRTT